LPFAGFYGVYRSDTQSLTGYVMKRVYSQIESAPEIPSRTKVRIVRGIGAVLTPFYLLAASLLGAPGIRMHIRCAALAFRLMINRRIPLSEALTLACYPFDSVRYFEFDTLWKWLHKCKRGDRHLDISSPRLFFLLLSVAHPELDVWLVNPDQRDMTTTQASIHALDLDKRCRTFNCLIADANLTPANFYTITSISVIEHIPEPDDLIALKHIWELLTPGGRLFLSVPCAAEAFEEYLNLNEYGILETAEDGYVYGQRFYDEELLQSRIFRILGQPERTRIYGEKNPGAFVASRTQKARDVLYPFWRESYMMGRAYRYFERVREMPGLGVICMEFVKTQEP